MRNEKQTPTGAFLCGPRGPLPPRACATCQHGIYKLNRSATDFVIVCRQERAVACFGNRHPKDAVIPKCEDYQQERAKRYGMGSE